MTKLREIEIYQLKYSSYTRNSSASIETLKNLFTSYSVTPALAAPKSARRNLSMILEEASKASASASAPKAGATTIEGIKRKKTKTKN